MVTTTTTYSLKKPTVGQDEDLWGGYLNDSMDLIDDVLDGTTPVTGIDINSGTIDNAVIGGTTPVAGTFTALSATTSLGVTGNITVSGTVDGVDIATRDGVLTTTTTTANAALPKAGGIMTGAITFATGQTFDGRDVSADGAKLDGIESGATADQTASEILTLIKTVDGAGSGLDADTLDGQQGSYYQPASTAITTSNIGSQSVASAGAIDNIAFRNGNSTNGTAPDNVTDNGHGYTTSVSLFGQTDGALYSQAYSSSWVHQIFGDYRTGYMAVRGKNNGTWTGWNTVWTSGNDGAGSGLDADTLDGVQGSNYLRSDTSDTFNGTLYVTGLIEGQGDVAIGGGGGYGYLKGYTANWNHFIGSRMQVSGSTASPTISGGHDCTFVEYLNTDSSGFKFKNSSSGSYVDVAQITRNGIFISDGSLREDYDALSGTTPTCNVNSGGAFSLSMTGNTTFTFTSPTSGYSTGFVLQLTGNGGTVTWPTSVKWAGGTAPDAPASGETDIYVFWTRDGGTNWYGVLSSDAAA